MILTRVLLASHGTDGARAAERAAIELCRESNAELEHLLVVPDFWKGMMGDDWLNNAVTQSRFGDYVENTLAREAAAEIDRITAACEQAGITCNSLLRIGKPAACLVSIAAEGGFDLVVIGSPRPKGIPGYRSRMELEMLARSLRSPLLTIPYPSE